MKSGPIMAAIFLLTGYPACAHRLDEYLQGALISIEKNRVHVEITLTPGIAVYRYVLAGIDTDADGVISQAEQRAYAGRVLRDAYLAIDGHPLTPRMVSARFPTIEDMKEGIGQIKIEFDAGLPREGQHRRLTFENHHQDRIAAYQVNCLVPRDPDIRVIAQNRNYSQSVYELDYSQAGVASEPLAKGMLGAAALLLFARVLWIWRKRDYRVAAASRAFR
ncbi:MAG: hypothetical protein JO307_10910 [Bryobacterales bacterium]|nr:hypothetical protein [Bryobacterales bacterium]MBV9401881.1 hypothetical protein [Bryobacterales bacterium]